MDHVVLHHAVSPGQQAIRNQHRVGRVKRRKMKRAGCCREHADAHQHPELEASGQHEEDCQKADQPIGNVRHDHNLFAIVAIRPSARKWATEHEGDREPKIEDREGQRKFGLLLRRRIEHLGKIDVQRESRHPAPDDRKRLREPYDDKRAEAVVGSSVCH